LIANGIRLELSRCRDETAQLAAYDDLRPRIEAAFRACLEGIDANRRRLGPVPESPPLRFNRNKKTKLSLKIGWQDFRGFSFLADPSPRDLAEESPGILTIRNVSGSNELYDALGDIILGPWGAGLEEEFIFCRLPHSSYHVTIKDGVNDDNLDLLEPDAATALRHFFRGLPDVLSSPAPFLPSFSSISLSSPLRFRFAKLSLWNRSTLVSRLQPMDSESRLVLSEIEQCREELGRQWKAAYGLPVSQEPSWAPHITLGYFPNPDIVRVSEARLGQWSEHVSARLENAESEFKSVSLYAFRDMATFVKAKGAN
jgi:hypothetical protein